MQSFPCSEDRSQALTCGLHEGRVIVDPTAEEEALLDSLITVTLDGNGTLLGTLSMSLAIVLRYDCFITASCPKSDTMGKTTNPY